MHRSTQEIAALQRRTLVVVVASQVLGGAGLAAGVTVGALLAQEMIGGEDLAGLPAGLFTLGSAAAALGVGRLSQRAGRRTGLAVGFGAGALGAAGVVLAGLLDSIPLLLVALLVYGSGTATNLQARYAGTDLAAPHQRASAVSVALFATTFGAVAGPNLVGPTGALAAGMGLPRLTGPFLLAAVAYAAAALVLLAFLRPDPSQVAAEQDAAERDAAERDAAEPAPAGAPTSRRTGAPPGGDPRGVVAGATVMVLTQVTMVAIMTMTPVHMRHHHHDLSDVGLVIGMHIAAMFLPSPLTGRLVDRVGRLPVAAAAAATLLASGLVAALAPGGSMALLTLALVLLGLGWNLGLISGTALVVDSSAPSARARTQGNVDVLVALAGAAGGALSGMVVGATDYATLSLGGGLLAVLLLPALAWQRRTPPAPDGAPDEARAGTAATDSPRSR